MITLALGAGGGCGRPDGDGDDVVDAAVIDASAVDAPLPDAPPIDAPPIDAAVIDAAVIDAALIDAALIDAAVIDAAAIDAAAIDAAVIDAAVIDAAVIDAAVIDATPIDAPVDAPICPAPTPGAVGGPCAVDSNCDSAAGLGDGICMRHSIAGTTWPGTGYCVNGIESCTDDASCGAGNQCVMVGDAAGAFRICLPACGVGPCACPAGQVCAAWYAGAPILGGDVACLPGSPAAVDGDVCDSFGDCAPNSRCLDDRFEYPDGQCHRVGCAIGDDTTCAGDGHCVAMAALTTGVEAGTACVDRCSVDSDCRFVSGYRCVDGGPEVGRYCRHPHAGDGCVLDEDCGAPGDWDCETGPTYPGGLCTPQLACPTPGTGGGCTRGSSICYDAVLLGVATDNVCADRCGGPIDTQGGCRAGYVCRDVAPAVTSVVLGCVSP